MLDYPSALRSISATYQAHRARLAGYGYRRSACLDTIKRMHPDELAAFLAGVQAVARLASTDSNAAVYPGLVHAANLGRFVYWRNSVAGTAHDGHVHY